MIIDVPLPTLPETPEGKRDFLAGMVHAAELMQALLAKHWLLGRDSVDLEAARVEVEGVILTAGEVGRLAISQEKAAEQQAAEEQALIKSGRVR